MLGINPLYVAKQMGHVDTTMVNKTYAKRIDGGFDGDKEGRLKALYTEITQKSKAA